MYYPANCLCPRGFCVALKNTLYKEFLVKPQYAIGIFLVLSIVALLLIFDVPFLSAGWGRSIALLLAAILLVLFGLMVLRQDLSSKNEYLRGVASSLGLEFTKGSLFSHPLMEGEMNGSRVGVCFRSPGKNGRGPGPVYLVVSVKSKTPLGASAQLRDSQNNPLDDSRKSGGVVDAPFGLKDKHLYIDSKNTQKYESVFISLKGSVLPLFEKKASFVFISDYEVGVGKLMRPGVWGYQINAEWIKSCVYVSEAIIKQLKSHPPSSASL